MTIAEEILQPYDCLLINLEIEDCPLAEIPLVDLFDGSTLTLLDNYQAILRDTIVEMLEDTTWLDTASQAILLDAGYGTYHIRDGGIVISLRRAALQRLVVQMLAARVQPTTSIQIPISIRFLLSDMDLPKAPIVSAFTGSVDTTPTHHSPPAPPSEQTSASESELLDQVPALPGISPILRTASLPDASIPVPTTASRVNFPEASTFRGHPVNMGPVGVGPPGNTANPRRTFATSFDPYQQQDDSDDQGGIPHQSRRGSLFDTDPPHRRSSISRTSTRLHPFSEEVTFGAETFEDYMSQFMYSEVRFKDFRKATIPKFDSTKYESFVHWYKLFCSTCLQWGIWCPPYESTQEDSIHGAWWTKLPQSVRNSDSFMSHLIYGTLILESTFPVHSREYAAVQGCPPNSGYHALYNLLRLHHPLLHSVHSTANEIPRQRRNEAFSQFIRRLQDFMARERLATRTYTESEALDLAVRNLTAEWRSEFRRMVERDKRTGPYGTLPFKLALPQLSTTFVEYAAEVGREPPGPGLTSATRPAPTSIMRRLEVAPDDETEPAILDDDAVDLIVRAIAQNQASSPLCLGCQLPGHTLVDCNRFVDYIVAESLAQRNPTLRNQVANSHQHFRNRLNAATTRSRMPTHGTGSTQRTVRSLHVEPSPTESTDTAPVVDNDAIIPPADDSSAQGYRQHSLSLVSDDPADDFESYFPTTSINSVHIIGVDDSSPLSADTVYLPPDSPPDTLAVRRLAATYDSETSAVYAHADNGSMTCTTNDAKLLFAYRPLVNSTVRLFDAGDHIHRPLGVGFLCIPTDHRGIGGAPHYVFVRTYHTPTIPGVIISHSALSKQLNTTSYFTSSHLDEVGFIHFPHRLRRCQDVYVPIQPISKRGGLTFTDALILPTDAQHRAPRPPWPNRVSRLCSDHQSSTSDTVLDPTDGMTCPACHLPPSLLPGTSCQACREPPNPPDFR